TSSLLAFALLADKPSVAQTVAQAGQDPSRLPQVNVEAPKPPPRPNVRPARPARQPQRAVRQPVPPPPQTTTLPIIAPGGPGGPTTPLNTNTVAESGSRLGLTAREIPATVEVANQETLQGRGLRTVTEAAEAFVGVTAGDAPGAANAFSMRGYSFSEINTLYNGIRIGPQSMTSRVMETGNLDRIEILK